MLKSYTVSCQIQDGTANVFALGHMCLALPHPPILISGPRLQPTRVHVDVCRNNQVHVQATVLENLLYLHILNFTVTSTKINDCVKGRANTCLFTTPEPAYLWKGSPSLSFSRFQICQTIKQ